ncbi:MAG TPA: WGR domain-containing protein [Rhodanobacteraceae bacterium]|nr:WGR domain-containing protein [Rhodanobacteraceae bacterium]
MRVYMQAKPLADEASRYVQLILEQDLLGGWTFYRESGVPGGRVSLRKQVFTAQDDALAAFEQARDTQLKRGFQVMFAKGMEPPHGV